MNCDGDAVMRELLDKRMDQNSRRLFLKHMAHHMTGLDLSFLNTTSNVFLIRDPREMLPSLVNQLPNAQLADTSLQQQWELFSSLADLGVTSAILDSRELLLDPAGVLEKLCDFLGLEFSAHMLHWDAGPREEDGVWAPYWYHAVHQSIGFEPYKPKTEFPGRLETLLADCQPWYEKLFERAIRTDTTGDST
jgi:hypothetical protein